MPIKSNSTFYIGILHSKSVQNPQNITKALLPIYDKLEGNLIKMNVINPTSNY